MNEPRHWDEWKISCVADEIIQSNVKWLEGDEVIEALCGDHLESLLDRNNPRYSGHSHIYQTSEAKNAIAPYERPAKGGWFVSGVDPLNNWQRMKWGQFKALNPRVNYKGKVIKYDQPIGQRSRAIFLDYSAIDWEAIQDDPSQLVFITEGAKKAGCLISLGFPTVAVPGIDNAAQKDEWGQRRLIPELKAIAQPGRQIVFVYDSDEKPRTQRHVYSAIKRAGRAFQDEGCEVSWVNWDKALGKGIDDVCAHQGADKVRELLSNPIRLKTFEEELYCVIKSVDQHVFE
jgi:hypothetical protein